MRARERQRLEAHLQRLKDKQQQVAGDIEHTARRLREATRYERQKRRLRYGELIELAGLDHLDPATLLGGLCEVAQVLQDPQACGRWQAIGEPMLTTHRTQRPHRTYTSVSRTHDTVDRVTDAREVE